MVRIDKGTEQPAVHELEQIIRHILISVMKDPRQLLRPLLILLKDRKSLREGLLTVMQLPGDRCAFLDPPQKRRDQNHTYDEQQRISQHLSEKICIRPSSYISSYCHIITPGPAPAFPLLPVHLRQQDRPPCRR